MHSLHAAKLAMLLLPEAYLVLPTALLALAVSAPAFVYDSDPTATSGGRVPRDFGAVFCVLDRFPPPRRIPAALNNAAPVLPPPLPPPLRSCCPPSYPLAAHHALAGPDPSLPPFLQLSPPLAPAGCASCPGRAWLMCCRCSSP